MPIDRNQIKALVFDYGNTLIEFTATQVRGLNRAIAEAMHTAFGPVDMQRYESLQEEAYRAPYHDPQCRETTVPHLYRHLVRELYDREPHDHELDPVLAAHDDVFVRIIEAPDYLHDLLVNWRQRYKLAVVSNYPCGRSIRASLESLGIADHLDAVVVSGDLGHVKPHPLLFNTILDAIDVEPNQAVFIGDNWLGDIQGAKRAGLWAVHTTQFDTLETFPRRDGDHDADLTIGHLRELASHL